MKAIIINPGGYTLAPTQRYVRGWPRYRRRRLYQVQLHRENPFTVCIDGIFLRPKDGLITDMGSVPELFQVFVPKDRFLDSFVLHDTGCSEHGLYFSSRMNGRYHFAPMSSKRVHQVLLACAVAECGGLQAHIAGWLVKAFGPRWDVGAPAPPPRLSFPY